MSGLRFNDGTTVITLEDTTAGTDIYWLVKYIPTVPELESEEVASDDEGAEIPQTRYKNVTETIEFYYDGGSASACVALAENLERVVIHSSKDYQRRRYGKQVWFEFRLLDTDAYWRSEVLNARMSYDERMLQHTPDIGMMFATIIFTRRYYFEGPLTELALTNGNGTNVTGGITVHNRDDGTAGRDNWVSIAGSNVLGTIPAPIRLEMTNTYNSGSGNQAIVIGHAARVQVNPAYLTFQGESGTSLGGTQTNISDAAYSNGAYRNAMVTDGNLVKWALSAAALSSMGGLNYMVVLFGYAPSGQRVGFYISIANITRLFESDLLSTTIFDPRPFILDTAQFPPYLLDDMTSMYPLEIALYGTGAGTYSIDAVVLIPTESWVLAKPRGYGWAYSTKLVIDAISGKNLAYTDYGGKLGNYVPIGPGISLVPGITNRIFFAWGSDDTNAAVRTMTLRAYYRPRRLVI